MAEPNKRPRLIRRTTPRFGQTYTAPADAVNETMRVSGMGPEQMAQRAAVVDGQRRFAEQQAQAQQRRRQQYRQRMSNQARANGQLDMSMMMSDDAVDKAMIQEQQQANQPQLRQGYDRPRINTERLADQYATVSNFYASLGSPNMMPMNTAQVQANPQIAAQQLQFGLDNPALTTLQIAAPTGGGTGAAAAAKTAFRGSMQTAKPLATRVVQGMGQATKAGGQALAQNALKVAGNLVVMGVPTAAAAADFGDENPQGGGEQGGSAMPWVIGAGTLIGGSYLFNKFRKGNTPSRWFTWWERNPNTVAANTRFNTLSGRYNTAFTAGDQAAMDALKTELGKSPQQTITQGTGRRAKTVDNPDFISNSDLGTMIQNRAYPQTEGFIIEPRSAKYWRGVRNWGIRFPIYSTVAGNIGKGVYDWMSNPSDGQDNPLPTGEQFASTYQETDAAVEGAAPGDTVVATPRAAQPDSVVTTPAGGIVWSTQQ